MLSGGKSDIFLCVHMENEAYVIYGESRKSNRISEEAEEHVCLFVLQLITVWEVSGRWN